MDGVQTLERWHKTRFCDKRGGIRITISYSIVGYLGINKTEQ